MDTALGLSTLKRRRGIWGITDLESQTVGSCTVGRCAVDVRRMLLDAAAHRRYDRACGCLHRLPADSTG